MIFTPGLAQKVLAGEKTVTRRLTSTNPSSPWWEGGCGYNQGQVLSVQSGRGKVSIGRIRVTRVDRSPLSAVDDAEARREGFESAAAFVEAWTQINGSYDARMLVWRLEFELVERVS